MERGERGIPESAIEQNRSEQYHAEAMETAQRISGLWKQLEGRVKANPNLLADSPKLGEIYDLTSSPKSGIQVWFEGQVSFIEQQAGDEDAKSRMMHRLIEDVERIGQEVEELIK